MKKTLTLSISLCLCLIVYGQNILAEHHFESNEISEVTIRGAFCDVYVSSGNSVVFDGIVEGNGNKDDYIIASIRSGDKVIFEVDRKSKGWNWNINDIDRARFDIEIPDGVSFKIDNSSGDIKIKGSAGSSYQAGTTSGDIYVSTVKGDLEVSSTSGDLQVKELIGNLSMKSTSGDQKIREVIGHLQTGSTSGDIEASEIIGNVELEATSGDIEINDAEGVLHIQTTSGDIRGDNIILTGNSSVRATSGDIQINFNNDLDLIGFDLRASSGRLRVGSISGDGRLELNRGSFILKGVTTSGSQRYE